MTNSDRASKHQVPNIPGSYFDLIMTARGHMAQRAWAEAAAIQERVIARIQRLPEQRRRPGSDLALFLAAAMADLVEVRAEQGEYATAADLCQQMQRLDADNADYWRQRIAILRIEQGEVAEGLHDLHELAQREPDNLEHWMALAQQGIEQDALHYAEEALDHAWMLAQENPDDRARAYVQFTRFRLYRAQNRWLEAGAAWRQAAVLDEEMRTATSETIVRMFLEAGLLDEALAVLDEEELDEAVANYYRAQIAFRRGDRVRAQYLWRQIAEAELADADANLAVQGMAYCWLGEPERALGLMLGELQRGLEFNVRNAVTLGTAWAMRGNLDAARTNFSMAVTSIAINTRAGKISRLDRWEFETLVQDAAMRAELLPYFEA